MNDASIITVGSVSLKDYFGFWSTELALPAWAAFVRETILVEIEPPEDRDDGRPSPTQLGAFEWLLGNEAATVAPVLGAIMAAYPQLRARYEPHVGAAELAAMMPPLRGPDDLAPLIDLRSLHFHDLVHGDVPYLGFLFGCTWDREHGLGVMMHGLRAVEVGGADTAILTWIAERDARGPASPSGS